MILLSFTVSSRTPRRTLLPSLETTSPQGPATPGTRQDASVPTLDGALPVSSPARMLGGGPGCREGALPLIHVGPRGQRKSKEHQEARV